MSRTECWGVLNVTPDSFSDGGRYVDLSAAVAHGARMWAEGARVIDVGGESTRPAGPSYGEGFVQVSAAEEIARVVPVIRRLRRDVGAQISVDTTKAEVASAAIEAGARIVNDVSGGASESLLYVVAQTGVQCVLMHTRAGGRVNAESTRYDDVVKEVLGELHTSIERAQRHGVSRAQIWIDPGIGFAKTAAQSAQLLGDLDVFVASGYPVLVAASRKSFIAGAMRASGAEAPGPGERLGGSLAAVTVAALAGCAAVRVHDVFESVQAVRTVEAMR